jgi:phosphoglycerol transferase MdoB-like AlkP superfamily enzyme
MIFNSSALHRSTFKHHLWVSLFLFLTLSTFGWHYAYFDRPIFLIQRYPLHLLPNWLMTLCISYLFALIIRNRLWHVSVLFTLFYFVATASRLKFESIGVPILAVDFSLGKYSDVLAEYLSVGIFVGLGFGLIVFNFATRFFSKHKLSLPLAWLERRTLLAALASLPIWFGLISKGTFGIGGFELSRLGRYMGNGDVVAIVVSIYTNEARLSTYRLRQETKARLEMPAPKNTISRQCQTTEKPDILVVMVESMFDPIQMPKITLTADPMAPLRTMGFNEVKTHLLVPVFGGATANTEFEFLTGSTHRFFPRGSIQYHHHLYSDINALPFELLHLGYRSTAIHNFRRGFWRRDEVYPLMGFESYYGLEDLKKLTSVPYYDKDKPRDNVLASFVPEQMKKHQNEPGFYFVVTMGTHGPYRKYLGQSQSDIMVSVDGAMNSGSLNLLQNYTNFLADSSMVLGDLFRHALGRSKPTIVVYFGDHLPGLPQDTYQDTGYYDWLKSETGIDSTSKIVPIHVLNNFGCNIEVPKTIASNCIASHLLSQVFETLPRSDFWRYNLEFCSKYPLIQDGIDTTSLTDDFADYAALIFENLFNWQGRKDAESRDK